MNLVEKLMKIDAKEVTKIETKKIHSKRLSNIFNEETYVTIRAIDGDAFMEISASGLREDGEVDISKAFDTNSQLAVEGIIEPDLKDEELQSYLGVESPADAAKVLFRGEVTKIAQQISKLSGFEDEDDEIKN